MRDVVHPFSSVGIVALRSLRKAASSAAARPRPAVPPATSNAVDIARSRVKASRSLRSCSTSERVVNPSSCTDQGPDGPRSAMEYENVTRSRTAATEKLE
jgi:hypothetical protein